MLSISIKEPTCSGMIEGRRTTGPSQSGVSERDKVSNVNFTENADNLCSNATEIDIEEPLLKKIKLENEAENIIQNLERKGILFNGQRNYTSNYTKNQ